MNISLTTAQKANRERAHRFAMEHVAPLAQQIDQERMLPATLIDALRADGWLGAALPKQWGGGGMDAISYGLAIAEFGAVCSSVRSLLTSHNMAAQALLRHGSTAQKADWLPAICSGKTIISFALTEENAGSVAKSITTQAVKTDYGYLVSGKKIWITCGLIAHLYLIFASDGDKHVALLIARNSSGLFVEPMPAALGNRGSMLASLRFADVAVPVSHRVGAVGAGISFVANTALDHGRFSVAWGAAGIIKACMDACHSYLTQRMQGGENLVQHQLVKRQLSDILVAYTTVRALCMRCACLRQDGDHRAAMETMLAKYHAASSAVEVTTTALRLHGANGYSCCFPTERYLRDAMALEIIEGTKEMSQIGLASYALQWPNIND